jgi:hydrogenase maturation protease
MKIAVIGIGQSFRGDDEIGLKAVQQWMDRYPETASRSEIQVDISELPGLTLLDLLEGAKAAVLVDAIECLTFPGTIHSINPEQLSSFTTDAKSAHGWGVAETLRMDQMLNPSRKKIPIKVIGIEVGQVEIGSALSKSVEQALPLVCEAIQKEVQTFLVSL